MTKTNRAILWASLEAVVPPLAILLLVAIGFAAIHRSEPPLVISLILPCVFVFLIYRVVRACNKRLRRVEVRFKLIKDQ